MPLINEQFLKLPESYLFSDIAKKVNAYKITHPKADILRLGIGDVTRPLPKAVIEALHQAVEEMADQKTFRGYGPEQGYRFLIDAIIRNDYESRGISMDPDEIFVSDGSKSDTGNIGDILRHDNTVALTDPVYPVYVDSNVMGSRGGDLLKGGYWSNFVYLPCTAENHFIPEIPEKRFDMLYLCYPNNPTGTVLSRAELKKWVDYALKYDVLILYDAAYEAYIREEDIPHSIYEIKGAKHVAIEFRSFSKTAGFTGLRCSYAVVPKALKGSALNGQKVSLNKLWNRRQCTKFNGTAYIVQRAAEATYSPQGREQVKSLINDYMENAELLRGGLMNAGFTVFGGVNSPYVWMKTPDNLSSWKFFDRLLYELQIVGTPGVGFGPSGEGYFRLTAFGRKEDTLEAIQRIRTWKV